MNEPQDEQPKKISRRGFLRRLKKAVPIVAGAALGGFVLREADHREHGVLTTFGRVKMIYERHGDQVKTEEIPKGADYFFREEIVPGFSNPEIHEKLKRDQAREFITDVLLSRSTAYPDSVREKTFQAFPDNLLKYLEKNHIALVLGDAEIAEFRTRDYLLKTSYARVIAGLGTIASSLLLGKTIEDRTLKATGNEDKAWSRREFTTVTGILLGAGFMANQIGGIINAIAASKGEKMSPPLEVLVRLTTNIHPEDVGVFFRNAVMALKILLAAKDAKQRIGKEPIGAALVEQLHAGIEDFLSLGEDILRLIITATPNPILQPIIKANGGTEQFASAVIVDLSSGMTDVHTRVLTDEKLVKMVEEKLSLNPKRE